MPTVILPKGSYIFHGTCETLSGSLRPGIDRLVWFADVPGIAHLYICPSGSLTVVRSEDIVDPHTDKKIVLEVRDLLNINFRGGQIDIPDPPGWNPDPKISKIEGDIYKFESNLNSELEGYEKLKSSENPLEKSLRENAKILSEKEERATDIELMLEKLDPNSEEYAILESEQMDIFDEMSELEDNSGGYRYNQALKSFERRIESIQGYLESLRNSLNRIINKDKIRKVSLFLKSKGFKNPDGSNIFRVMMDKGEILMPGNYKPGTMVVGRTLKDLTLWDKANHSMNTMADPQYGDFKGFRDAEKKGLDGVFIKDYAQSREFGNFQHLSVGIFNHSLKHIKYKYIPTTYREWDRSSGGRSPVWSGPVSDFSELRSPR